MTWVLWLALASAWYACGAAGYAYWTARWNNNVDFVVAFLVAFCGPFSWFIGYLLDGQP